MVERGQFSFDAQRLRRKIDNPQPVLSPQGLERGGMALDLLLARGIDVEGVEVAPQRVGGFLGVDHGLRQQLDGSRELRVGVPGIAQRGAGPAQ